MATPLYTNVHPLSVSPRERVREAWRGLLIVVGFFGEVWEAWGGVGRLGQGLGNALGKLGGLGRLGECFGMLCGSSGTVGAVWARIGEYLGSASGRLGEVLRGLGRIVHLRSASLEKLGRLGQAWECLAVLRAVVSPDLYKK